MITSQLFGRFGIARIGDLKLAFGIDIFHDRIGGNEDSVAVGCVGFFEDGINIGDFGEEERFEEGVVGLQVGLD